MFPLKLKMDKKKTIVQFKQYSLTQNRHLDPGKASFDQTSALKQDFRTLTENYLSRP
jgi:hypothetical protein